MGRALITGDNNATKEMCWGLEFYIYMGVLIARHCRRHLRSHQYAVDDLLRLNDHVANRDVVEIVISLAICVGRLRSGDLYGSTIYIFALKFHRSADLPSLTHHLPFVDRNLFEA